MNDDDMRAAYADAMKSLFEDIEGARLIWTGVDWAKGSGKARGDVIKSEGNVTHVRFNDVS